MNYVNAFISVAEDCPATTATVPPQKEAKKSAAQVQYEMLAMRPYAYTQEDVLFESCAAVRENPGLPLNEKAQLREAFFAKPQACLRASALPKRYGWGIHFDAEGKAAAYAVDSEKYQRLSADPLLKQLRAMRSKRA